MYLKSFVYPSNHIISTIIIGKQGIDLGGYFTIVNGNCQIYTYDFITYMYVHGLQLSQQCSVYPFINLLITFHTHRGTLCSISISLSLSLSLSLFLSHSLSLSLSPSPSPALPPPPRPPSLPQGWLLETMYMYPEASMFFNYMGLTLVPVHSQQVLHSCWGCSLLFQSSWSEHTTNHHHCY